MLPWDERCLVLLAALALDWLIGDPPWLWSRVPHPVVLIGRLIGRLDAMFNREQDPDDTRQSERICRHCLCDRIDRTAWVDHLGLGRAPCRLASSWKSRWWVSCWPDAVWIRMCNASLTPLASGSLADARKAVSHIVGRETDELDRSAVSRAAIESASENFADGLIAPALWYLAGGLPGLLVYKAINTADSMIGYRSERHGAFGKWAAHIDDAANLVPARWSGLLIAVAAAIRQFDPRSSLRIMWQDAPRHVSPNAGWPEAAMAGCARDRARRAQALWRTGRRRSLAE